MSESNDHPILPPVHDADGEQHDPQHLTTTADYQEERVAKRAILRRFLPPDLQLRFRETGTEEQWDFEGALLRRIHSEEEETDKIFFDALLLYRQQTREGTSPDLSQLQEKLHHNREAQARHLRQVLIVEEGLEECMTEGLWGSYAYLLKTASEAGILSISESETHRQAVEEGLERCLAEGLWSNYASLLKTASEVGALSISETHRQAVERGLERCLAEGSWGSYASLLKTASGAGILSISETHRQAVEEGLEGYSSKGWWSDYASLLKTSSEVGILSFERDDRLMEVLSSFPPDTHTFVYASVAVLLEQERDLGTLSELVLVYRALEETLPAINSTLPPEKQWEHPQDIFSKHAAVFAKLLTLDATMGAALARKQAERGLSYLQAHLQIYDQIQTPLLMKTLSETVARARAEGKGFNDYGFDMLLQTACGYEHFGISDAFVDICKQGKRIEETQHDLSVFLLQSLAQSLGIDPQRVQDADLSQWHMEYLPNLTTHLEMLRQKGDLGDVVDIFTEMLGAVFEDRFPAFITDTDQESSWGKRIAEHNGKVQQTFEEKGISWESWQNPDFHIDFDVATETRVDREALFAQFDVRLESLVTALSAFEPALGNALSKDRREMAKQKKHFDPQSINMSDESTYAHLFPSYIRTLAWYRKKAQREGRNFSFPTPTTEAFMHLSETIQSLKQEGQQHPKTFTVRTWDRDPRRDLFQGNFTHCCISVGVKEGEGEAGVWETLTPEAIIEYLIDKGIQVVEVVDDTEKPVAQAWVFVSLDSEGHPVMVADNIEVNLHYPSGSNANTFIREALFRYLQEYTVRCHIPTVVLGRIAYNDVQTDDLESVDLPPVEKLGGYLWGESEPYYLEAREQTSVHRIV